MLGGYIRERIREAKRRLKQIETDSRKVDLHLFDIIALWITIAVGCCVSYPITKYLISQVLLQYYIIDGQRLLVGYLGFIFSIFLIRWYDERKQQSWYAHARYFCEGMIAASMIAAAVCWYILYMDEYVMENMPYYCGDLVLVKYYWPREQLITEGFCWLNRRNLQVPRVLELINCDELVKLSENDISKYHRLLEAEYRRVWAREGGEHEFISIRQVIT